MLPSGRFPRFALAAALLFALLLVLDLNLVRSAVTGLLLSNSLDLAIVLLATICSFYAARRSSGYARQLWLLLAIAFSLDTAAQAITTYYQSFVPNASHSPWPSDVLFFVWPAPVFMMFLPRSEDDSSAIDSLRLLDFLQVAILAVTIYVYFFFSPLRWQTNQNTVLRQILILYIVRDSILAAAFFLRSRATLPSWIRSFSFTLALVFLAACISDAHDLVNLVAAPAIASYGDLLWMLPSLIVIYFAASWRQADESFLKPATSSVGKMLGAQILPVAMPLLVIFMSRAIAREQPVFAWLAITASVLCSSVRLILTNRRQRRIADDLLATERALRSSEEILSTAFRNSPDAFSINPFPNGPYLDVNEGYARLTGYSREEALGKTPRQMNLWVDFESRDQVLAALRESGHVRDFEFRFRTRSGAIRIGQMSASIIDIQGQLCSLVIVRDITERKAAEELLRSSEERFRSLVSDFHFAVVLHSPDARIEFANRAAHHMFQLPDGSAIGRRLPELGISVVDEFGNDIPNEDRPVLRVLRTRAPIYDALTGYRYPGSAKILWTYGNIVPQFNANGDLVRLISSYADVTAMKSAEQAIHSLSTRLLNLQDEERRRLGRELHDGLAQTVLAINLSLAQVRQSLSPNDDAASRSLDRARDLTQQMSREIRTLSYLLHPPLLDDLGLVSTLKEYAHGFSERSGIQTQFIANTQFERLPQSLEIALFRIVQESLTNIQRHSGSASAEIRLIQQNSLLTLEVVDHGHGMHLQDNSPVTPSELFAARHPSPLSTLAHSKSVIPSAARNPSSIHPATPPPDNPPTNHEPRVAVLGVGIPGMRERMAQLGGHLDILSGPTGTTIRATISRTLSPTELHDALASHLDRR